MGLDGRPRRSVSEDTGGPFRANPGKSADRTPGGAHDRGIREGVPLPRGRMGGASCATSGNHLPMACPIGTKREGRRGCAAAAAHRGLRGHDAAGLAEAGRTPVADDPFRGSEASDFALARHRSMTGGGGALACL